ncbi:MAG: adenylate kinase, partial [bacterium]
LQASPMNIVLFGRPGAGKGTQGKLIAKEYDLLYISTGKLFRDEIRNGTEIGREAAAFMEQGTLVPDRIVIKLIEKKIKMNPMAKGFVFKGFPRTMVQAYILKGLLRKRRSSISCMIDISVPMLDCMKRLSERGKTEEARPYDRDVEMVIQRMEEYQEKTVPVSSYYYKRNKVLTVDGKGTPESVFENVKEVVDRTFRNVR